MKTSKSHFDFLDGIRGLSAFYVVLTHAYNTLFYAGIAGQGRWPHAMMAVLKPLAFGRYAVDTFIVLSGYCLMLPVARSGGLLKGGFGGYLKRRAKRILPPYYAALVLSVVILILRHQWIRSASLDTGDIQRGLERGSLFTHLLLVHNLFDRWAHSINSPLWSVASEWQIYFFFPALLLPVWRAWNIAATVVVAFATGYTIHLAVPGGLEAAAPWYIGLFALGMAAASMAPPALIDSPAPDRSRAYGGLCLGLLFGLAITGSLAQGWFRENAWLIDPVFGVAAMCLILHCTTVWGRRDYCLPTHLKLLQSRPLVGLGAFSYSLYLAHYPLIELAGLVFNGCGISPGARIMMTFGVGVPAVTGLAYLFHLAFERPFMPGQPRNIKQAELAAGISPAP